MLILGYGTTKLSSRNHKETDRQTERLIDFFVD